MSEQLVDPVVQLQDLRERLHRGEEISAIEYEQVLSALRMHRRAGSRAVKTEKKAKGSSTVEAMSIEQMNQALESF